MADDADRLAEERGKRKEERAGPYVGERNLPPLRAPQYTSLDSLRALMR